MKIKDAVKEKLKKTEYHPEKYTEKFILSKISYIIIQFIILCLSFGLMFGISIKKIISAASSMFFCTNKFNVSFFEGFLVGVIIIFIFITLLTIVLFLLNFIFGVKLSLKKCIAIVMSSYLYFSLASLISSILFLISWGYLGYILLIVIFFLTQFNVYKTYYSLLEKHDKFEGVIVAIIYIITSISVFIILNLTLFNYLETLYKSFC